MSGLLMMLKTFGIDPEALKVEADKLNQRVVTIEAALLLIKSQNDQIITLLEEKRHGIEKQDGASGD